MNDEKNILFIDIYSFGSCCVVFSAYGYVSLDTILNLKSEISLPIYRKTNTYGLVRGVVLDLNDNPIYNAQVNIMEYMAKTDKCGAFSILLPLEKQNSSDEGYILTITTDSHKIEEKVYPEGDNNITNTIYMP